MKTILKLFICSLIYKVLTINSEITKSSQASSININNNNPSNYLRDITNSTIFYKLSDKELEENEKANQTCQKMANITIRNQYDCLTNITIQDPAETYVKTAEGVKECCFYQKQTPANIYSKIGYCELDFIVNNGTTYKGLEYNFTKICVPFNETAYELKRLKEYNEELAPCAVNVDIETSQDCYDEGDENNFCCHVSGYISGVRVNQCYSLNKNVSNRAGTFISNGLTFACEANYISWNIYLVMLLIILYNLS